MESQGIARGDENREQRKTIKRYQHRIAELETQSQSLQAELTEHREKN